MNKSAEQLADSIDQLLRRPNPVLFAGAGVACRVGLPDWDGYIESLAAFCDDRGDSGSAQLIRERLKRGSYLKAASVFKTSDALPAGELLKALAAPFRGDIPDSALERLTPLVGLGFTAIVTTNFDRSLLDARSRTSGRWIPPVERGALAGKSLNRDFFVARIHGSAEAPDLMVVDDSDYLRLRGDEDYLDFLLDILKGRSCLFLGFSFLDPAIDDVLTTYASKCGPTFSSLHTAIIPDGQPALEAKLRSLNIEVHCYATADGHADLWRAVRLVYDRQQGVVERPPTALPPQGPQYGLVHRVVAFSYAQVQSQKKITPVLELVQDGVVSSLLAETPGEPVTVDALCQRTAAVLSVSNETARTIVEPALHRLEEREQILRDDSQVMWCGSLGLPLEAHLGRLAQAVVDRMRIREGVKAGEVDKQIARNALERVLLARAWDLASHYSGGASLWGGDLDSIIKQTVSEFSKPGFFSSSPGTLERAVRALLVAPDDEEALLLAPLARAAFGVQLLMSSPRSALHRKYSLPQRVYLDANVLMPAITAGHPLRPVYSETLERLSAAAADAGASFRIVVGEQFLNEIVSHRRLAVQLVDEARLEEPESIARHIQFHGALNTNVFVGAYASFVGRSKQKLSFTAFLDRVAPYGDEVGLAEYLGGMGVVTEHQAIDNADYVSVLNPLLSAYEEARDVLLRGKEAVLIRHEALQLGRLLVDAREGTRSLFVTADSRLRRALVTHSILRKIASHTVSQIGLVAITDVMVGLAPDSRSFSRLVWAAPTGTAEHDLFEFFVDRGLQHYREGLGMDLQDIATIAAKQAAAAATSEGVDLFSADPREVAKTAAFLDRFEKNFYQYWREAEERNDKSN